MTFYYNSVRVHKYNENVMNLILFLCFSQVIWTLLINEVPIYNLVDKKVLRLYDTLIRTFRTSIKVLFVLFKVGIIFFLSFVYGFELYKSRNLRNFRVRKRSIYFYIYLSKIFVYTCLSIKLRENIYIYYI